MPNTLVNTIEGREIDGNTVTYKIYTHWQGGYEVTVERNGEVIASTDQPIERASVALGWIRQSECRRERNSYEWQQAWDARTKELGLEDIFPPRTGTTVEYPPNTKVKE